MKANTLFFLIFIFSSTHIAFSEPYTIPEKYKAEISNTIDQAMKLIEQGKHQEGMKTVQSVINRIGEHLEANRKYQDLLNLYLSILPFLNITLQNYKNKNNQRLASQTINDIYLQYYKAITLNNDYLVDYKHSVKLYKEVIQLYGSTKNQYLKKAGLNSARLLANEYFGKGEFGNAKKYFDLADQINGTRFNSFERKIFEERLLLGNIQPEYTQKILTLVIRYTNDQSIPQFQGVRKENREINPAQYKRLANNILIFKRIVEVFSRGKLSINLKIYYLDSEIRIVPDSIKNTLKLAVVDYDTLSPFPDRIMLDNISDTDMFFMFYRLPFRANSRGGNSRVYPVIPYQLHYPKRGGAHYNNYIFNQSQTPVRLIFHEYFHACERILKFTPIDNFTTIKEFFPNYINPKKYNDKVYDYYFWQFSENIPRIIDELKRKGDTIGWKKLSYSYQYPFTMSLDLISFHADAVKNISIENRRKAYYLYLKAWEENYNRKKELAIRLLKEAIALNPSSHFAHKLLGKLEEDKKNYSQAVMHYETSLKFIFDSAIARKIGMMLYKHLQQKEKAKEFFLKSIQYAVNLENKYLSYVNWLEILIDDQQWTLAKEIVQEINPELNVKLGIELTFLKGFVLYQSNERNNGLLLVESALNRGINKNITYGNLIWKTARKLLANGKFQTAANLAKLGIGHTKESIRIECTFTYGESLYKIGQKELGIQTMRSVLNTRSQQMIRRFRKITGLSFP